MDYGIPAPAYRLPATARVGAVSLLVSDLERSIHFYTSALGLQIVDESDGTVGLSAGSGAVPLLHLTAGARPFQARRTERLGLYHFALLVPDRPALGAFIGHVSSIGVPLATADHAVSEATYLWDPDGLGIEVYVDRPRDTWRVHGRELFMTTEQLNVRALVETAQGRPWTGMPIGTTVGHIHLHVGDLDRAREFYHLALGLDQTFWSYPGALFLSAGGYHHHLGLNTWAANAPSRSDDEPGLLEWELLVPQEDDVRQAATPAALGAFEVARDKRGVVYADAWGTRVRLASPA